GVDEDLERAAVLVLVAGVEHDVVDGHVHGVLHQRGLDLVGAADQHFRALDALVHVDDVGLPGQLGLGLLARDGGAGDRLVLVLGGDDGVTGDFLVDLDGHCVVPGIACCWGNGMVGARSRPGGRRGRVARGGGCGYWSVAVLRAAVFFAAGFASCLAAFFTNVFFAGALVKVVPVLGHSAVP